MLDCFLLYYSVWVDVFCCSFFFLIMRHCRRRRRVCLRLADFCFFFGSYISNGLFALCVWCGDDGGKLCRVFGVSTIVATVDFFFVHVSATSTSHQCDGMEMCLVDIACHMSGRVREKQPKHTRKNWIVCSSVRIARCLWMRVSCFEIVLFFVYLSRCCCYLTSDEQ